MRSEFTTVIERDGEWFVAWSPEIPGANGQGRSIAECRESLSAAIRLILDDRREAQAVLLDQIHFTLDEEAFQRFTAMIDAPPEPNPGLACLLGSKAPWEQ